MLCDAPGGYGDAADLNGVAKWARKWDNAVFKLKGTSEQFRGLKKVQLATQPPRFGSSLYNAGHSLGTPLKISSGSHVLRHALFNRYVSFESAWPFADGFMPTAKSSDLMEVGKGRMLLKYFENTVSRKEL